MAIIYTYQGIWCLADTTDKSLNNNTLSNGNNVSFVPVNDYPFVVLPFNKFNTDSGFLGPNTKVADFESSSSQYLYITDANQTGLLPPATGTLYWFIRLSANFESLPTDGNSMCLVSKWQDADTKRAYKFSVVNSGGSYFLDFETHDDSENVSHFISDAITININTWYDLGFLMGIVDNQIVVSSFGFDQGDAGVNTISLDSVGFATGNGDFAIGRRGSDNADYFDGKITSVIIQSLPLSMVVNGPTDLSNSIPGTIDGSLLNT